MVLIPGELLPTPGILVSKGSQGGDLHLKRDAVSNKGITGPINTPVVMSRTCDFPDVGERGNNNA